MTNWEWTCSSFSVVRSHPLIVSRWIFPRHDPVIYYFCSFTALERPKTDGILFTPCNSIRVYVHVKWQIREECDKLSQPDFDEYCILRDSIYFTLRAQAWARLELFFYKALIIHIPKKRNPKSKIYCKTSVYRIPNPKLHFHYPIRNGPSTNMGSQRPAAQNYTYFRPQSVVYVPI